MKVLVARTAGFCMGVERAVAMALEAVKKYPGPVYTLGPLIHNHQVTSYLKQKGICEAESIPESGVVIIRAHGVSPQVIDKIIAKGLRIIDATCPHVRASQKIIIRDSTAGRNIIIAGDRMHPEVTGLAGQSKTAVTILSGLEEAENFTAPEANFSLIAQTTFKADLYEQITQLLSKRYPGCKVYPSICNATANRQEEVRTLAKQTGIVVVVGGKHSANTCRLAQISREEGAETFHVEKKSELEPQQLLGYQKIALTAGASTPSWIIEEVKEFLENL